MEKDIRALCYQHHVEMRIRQVPPNAQPESRQFPTYACPEEGCAIQYNSSEGYFIAVLEGSQIEQGMQPRVMCLQDKALMYLTAVPQIDVRHWKCPQCAAIRTNDKLAQRQRS